MYHTPNLTQARFQDAEVGYPAFTWYSFRLNVPLEQGISSFSVEISENGISSMETNGGGGFPVDDRSFPIVATPDNESFGFLPERNGSCRPVGTFAGATLLRTKTAVRSRT